MAKCHKSIGLLRVFIRKKSDWICSHAEFVNLAHNTYAKAILQSTGISISGTFTIAVTHGSQRKSGVVIRCYLNNILKAIEQL